MLHVYLSIREEMFWTSTLLWRHVDSVMMGRIRIAISTAGYLFNQPVDVCDLGTVSVAQEELAISSLRHRNGEEESYLLTLWRIIVFVW